mmetsp:Transcript_41758/g.97502  ORF Transcript_41758/g.97502 Transcript_41758/m.97502 type:complete len:353 (+) Transcript_41758:76-1134(+)
MAATAPVRALASDSREGPSQRSSLDWAKRVQDAHQKRSPEEWSRVLKQLDSAREVERQSRKAKAVKKHAIRSRALAAEGLRQMSMAPASEHMAVQTRWQSAQYESTRHTKMECEALDRAGDFVLADEESEEDVAMVQTAQLMGAEGGAAGLSALGNEGLTDAAPRRPTGGGDELLKQLRTEPTDETECAAKFMLYEGYSKEVEEMRSALIKFHDETKPTLPSSVAKDLSKQVKQIDSTEAMGIPDESREWFVFHMMKQAERNNVNMAKVLDNFEKKLEFLAKNDQQECPVCLDKFTESGPQAPETLGCCHKVCKECWESWTAVTRGSPFCPLCRHNDFLGRVAAHLSEGEIP